MDDTANTQSSSSSSNSKMMIIVAIIIVLVLLGAGGYYVMSKTSEKPSSTTTAMAPKATPTSSSMFSSISDALSKSLSLQCAFSDETSGMKTIAYIKSGAIRGDVTGKTASQNSSFIMKDKTMYFWTGKRGMMMAFDPAEMMKEIPSSRQKPSGMPSEQNGANMMGSLEKFKESCKPATVDDALFVKPSDVTFQDLSKMMPSGMSKISGAPAAPSGMSQEQIQQMQKQMIQKYAPTGQ